MIHSFSLHAWQTTVNIRRMFGWMCQIRVPKVRRIQIEEAVIRAVFDEELIVGQPDGTGDYASSLAYYGDAQKIADVVRSCVEFESLEALGHLRRDEERGVTAILTRFAYGSQECGQIYDATPCSVSVDRGTCRARKERCPPPMPHCQDLGWCDCGRPALWADICEAFVRARCNADSEDDGVRLLCVHREEFR